jgi:ubiquinone/menaquinone biosynthesis C-methylase UbiE
MDSSPWSKEVRSHAKLAYETMETIWPDSDDWSVYTKRTLTEFIQQNVPISGAKILNAGCGGHDYELHKNGSCVNLDISFRQCVKLPISIVGDIATLPFKSNQFDIVVCVGAVINYSEPYDAIPELVRVLAPGGLLILDFETSDSAELLFSKQWRKRVSVVERLYAGRLDKTLVFSTEHLRRLLTEYGIGIITTRRYHTATAIWRRIFPSSRLPNIVLAMDSVLGRSPGIKSLSSNVVMAGQKL